MARSKFYFLTTTAAALSLHLFVPENTLAATEEVKVFLQCPLGKKLACERLPGRIISQLPLLER